MFNLDKIAEELNESTPAVVKVSNPQLVEGVEAVPTLNGGVCMYHEEGDVWTVSLETNWDSNFTGTLEECKVMFLELCND